MSDYSKLKQLAEASIQAWDQHSKADSHKFYEAWRKAEEEFSTAAREEVVLGLITENERLATQVRLAGVSAEVTVHQEVGRAITETLTLTIERDQLKAENVALRKERDNLREERDGLLEAGAHLL